MTSANPKILNLDELETPEADISIVHDGKTHTMRTLTVDRFIEQQKRAAKHQTMVDAKSEVDVTEADTADAVQLIKDSVSEFFPTLPLGEMPTVKLFAIFNWLGEMSAQINDMAAPDSGDGIALTDAEASAEGNVAETPATS